ncbi:hypothetical protein F8388_014283 [Cannabis sativa]|uniref:RNase H type-1 domain-containing protein n=1 Tax=Cannabis sativa TaxID=3483 RepID=A0A7J6GS17_CANSA|nr:hypothetical protein F8388_014283 [Cannabis sativa]
MSVFLLSRKITDWIDSILMKFWWTGHCKESMYLSLKAWDSIWKPYPVAASDSGIQRILIFAYSLSSDGCWLQELCLSGLRLLLLSIVDTRVFCPPAFLLRPLLWLEVFGHALNCVWIIGQDSSVDIWCQQWKCGDGSILNEGAINPLIKEPVLVGDLVGDSVFGWNSQLVNMVFIPEVADTISSSHRNALPVTDLACWKSSNDGNFSLKVAYCDLNKDRFETKDDVCSQRWFFGFSNLRFGISCPMWKRLVFFLYGAILYHKLWLCHNEIFHRGMLMDVDMVRKRVEDCFLEHNRLLVEEKGNGEGLRGVAEVRWVLPRPGRVRGFVDFALADGVGAVAAVFFDNLSSVKAFGAKKVDVQSVFHGEMEALRFGVDLALEMQFGGIDFFSDDVQLVNALVAGHSPLLMLLRGGLCLTLVIACCVFGRIIKDEPTEAGLSRQKTNFWLHIDNEMSITSKSTFNSTF